VRANVNVPHDADVARKVRREFEAKHASLVEARRRFEERHGTARATARLESFGPPAPPPLWLVWRRRKSAPGTSYRGPAMGHDLTRQPDGRTCSRA